MNATRKVHVVASVLSVASISCGLLTGTSSRPSRQEQTTNSSGVATFSDPGSDEKVVITVLDEGEVLPRAEVAYLHGQVNPFELFLARDNRGLLAAEFFLHNSEHTIEVTRGEIRTLNPDQVRAAAGYLTDTGLVSRSTYKETISNAEMKQTMSRLEAANDVMLFFIARFFEYGKAAVKCFLGPISKAIGYLPRPEDPNVRWDHYEVYDAEWGYAGIVFVQSQPPLMQSPTLDVGEDGTVSLSLLAIDPAHYSPESTQFAGMPDYTIFEGATEFSDLVYSYELEDGQGHLVTTGIQEQASVCEGENCVRTEIDLGTLKAGEYYIRVWADDEAGNSSLPVEFAFDVISTSESPPTATPIAALPDYSDPAFFLAELKRAFETADYETADKLLIPKSKGDLTFGFSAYYYETQPASHSDAMDWFRERAPLTVDISGRAEDLYNLLADPKPDAELIALVEWEGGQEPSFLLIRWEDDRYWWDGFLAISCTSTLGGPAQEEARRRFCDEIGSGQTVGPQQQFNYGDYDQFVSAVEELIRNWDNEHPERLLPFLYDSVSFWGCWAADGTCDGPQPFAISPPEATLDYLAWIFSQGSEGYIVSASRGDTSCFPETPVYAEHTISVQGSQVPFCLGIAILGEPNRYYITDIWR